MRLRLVRLVDPLRQCRDGGRFEDRPERQRHAECIRDSGQYPARQRVAEKLVADQKAADEARENNSTDAPRIINQEQRPREYATPENTLLLYDNEELGVRFLYPRGWRVGAVQGKQLTLDHARGGGLLITVEPSAKIPSADDYLKETLGVLEKQKATVTATGVSFSSA